MKYDPFPYEKFDLEIDEVESSKLYIANYSKLHNKEVYSVFDKIENKLIQEYFDRVLERAKSCIRYISENDNFILINGNFIKTEMNSYDIKSHTENGNIHANMFINGESTINYMDELLLNIKNQS